MDDKLETIYEIQKQFTDKFFKSKNLILEEIKDNNDLKIKWNKEYILAIIKETTELLDEINWKMHHQKDSSDIRDNFLEESIDALKYLLGLLIINGFSIDEIYNKFLDKSFVVEARFKQSLIIDKIRTNKNKIALIDIDGVLCKYPDCFIEFVNKKYQQSFSTLEDLKLENKKLFFEAKHEYRIQGIKEFIPINEYSQQFLESLNKLNVSIILLTARPYQRIFRIYSDTLNWLKNNKLIYDAIIWNKDKAKYAIEFFEDSDIVFCVDDDIKNCNDFAESGFKTFLVKNKKLYKNDTDMYNKFKYLDKRVTIIENLNEIEL